MITLPDTNGQAYVVITGKQYCRSLMEAAEDMGYMFGAAKPNDNERIRRLENYYRNEKELSFLFYPKEKQLSWCDESWYRNNVPMHTPFFHFLDLIEEQPDFSDLDNILKEGANL